MDSRTESDAPDDSNFPRNKDVHHLSEFVSMIPTQPLTKQRNVFKGWFKTSPREIVNCAIKFPHNQQQCEREKGALTQIGTEDHVISLLHVGHFMDGGIDHHYIVLEECHATLSEYMLQRKETTTVYNVGWGINTCQQIINGVTAIHDKMIIHKDLKPSNVLLSHNLQRVKIADFGSSQILENQAFTVYCPDMFGTLGFRPPESFGDSYISLRTDIFALGALFYYILSNGKSPFGEQEVLWNHNMRNEIKDISELLVPNKETTKHLIESMLSTKRRNRPSIWSVSSHPCWTRGEVHFHYKHPVSEIIKYKPRVRRESETDRDFADVNELITALGDFIDTKRLLRYSAMFATETSIAICNKQNSSIMLFSPKTRSFSHFHDYNDEMKNSFFSTVSLKNYLYVLTYDKSLYRLKLTDRNATWERMQDMIAYQGKYPPAVANGNGIYVVSSSDHDVNRHILRFDSSCNSWKKLANKTSHTFKSSIASVGHFIYSIGGAVDQTLNVTDVVERIDLVSGVWERVAPLSTARYQASSLPYAENIFVIGGCNRNREYLNLVEVYDHDLNQWSSVTSMVKPRWGPRFRCHAIDNEIHVVGGDGKRFGETVEKYIPRMNAWSMVGMNISGVEIWSSATVVQPKANH